MPRGLSRGQPLDPRFQDRIDLYNIYHLFNHALLFGGGYASCHRHGRPLCDIRNTSGVSIIESLVMRIHLPRCGYEIPNTRVNCLYLQLTSPAETVEDVGSASESTPSPAS